MSPEKNNSSVENYLNLPLDYGKVRSLTMLVVKNKNVATSVVDCETLSLCQTGMDSWDTI